MFKVGDIIKLRANEPHYYENSELNKEVYVDDIIDQSYVIIFEVFNNYAIQGMKNGNEYNLSIIDSYDFKMDPVCLRKQKLEKLCLSQEIK